MRALLFSLCSLFALIACRPEPRLPQWDTRIATPLVNSRLQINDLVADSNIAIDPDGRLNLIFRQRLAELIPNEIVTPLTDSFQNVIKLQDIDLGSPSFADFITLGELSQGSTAGALIIANHGQRATVPPFPPRGGRSFTVDASALFQSISLSAGQMEVTIENHLPVALTDIEFRLRNQSNSQLLVQSNVDTIAAMATYQQQFSLANKTIEGTLDAVLQRFSSPGSMGDTVLIDTSDQVVVRVRLSNLQPLSATAIFPDQILANDTNLSDPIEVGQAQLTAIEVSQGSVYLDARSTIEDVLRLNYRLPGAQRNGSALQLNALVPAAPTGQLSTSYREQDVSGYRIDLTGLPNSTAIYNRFYSILQAGIDSSGRLINLSLNDSVELRTGIRELTADKGFGYLGRDTLSSMEREAVDFFDFLGPAGSFDLSALDLSLEVENYIGAPLSLQLQELQSYGNSDTVVLSSSLLNQDQLVPAASLNAGVPQAGRLLFALNSGNSNIDALFENRPQMIEASLEAVINGSVVTPDYNQFIFSDFGVKSYLNLKVPLSLSASNINLRDTSAFNYSDFDPKNQLQEAELKLIVENHFPLQGELSLILLDEQGELLEVLTAEEGFSAPPLTSNRRVLESQRSVIHFPINAVQLGDLRQCHHIVFDVSLDTAPGDPITIGEEDYIDLTLAGDLNIRTH